MNILLQKALNFSRTTFIKLVKPGYAFYGNPRLGTNIEYGNKLIYRMLMSDGPVMIARMGTTENEAVINFLSVKKGEVNVWKYISARQHAWWWNGGAKRYLTVGAGFFPATDLNLTRFGQLMLDVLPKVDLLVTLSYSEEYLSDRFKGAKRLTLPSSEPWFATQPWTHALQGKKVLVVHPMVETFEKQYAKRTLIWPDGLLPEFELKTIKAVQTVAGEKSAFVDWFEALDSMKKQMEEVEFDIAIIGCGAYGFPLAAHAKDLGKKAVHLAGATQLLFGVLGKRWEVDPHQPFRNLFNEHWVRPNKSETPQNANQVEGACYW